ncbi:MAG: hypothetical protein K940chlam7_01751 [Chlamydiae bacterium]|nr:hypothetical protein [Chlamydiota bacterium]
MTNQLKWTVHALLLKAIGEPYTGNLYVRFDEGGGLKPPPLLYRLTDRGERLLFTYDVYKCS